MQEGKAAKPQDEQIQTRMLITEAEAVAPAEVAVDTLEI
jgi:hypothetical protein